MLETQNISLSYIDGRMEREILSNVNIKIADGEFAAILGPSGSGKSSLIYILSLLRKPTQGSIFLDGQLVAADNHAADTRYSNFGFIFQQHYLIPHLNVIDNICVADYRNNLRKEAADLADSLGLGNLLRSEVYKLSGGEKQRVAIARALIKKPRVIFADEPTASLNHDIAMEIMQLLNKHRKANTTIICTTHDYSVLPVDAKRFYIKNKLVVPEGGV